MAQDLIEKFIKWAVDDLGDLTRGDSNAQLWFCGIEDRGYPLFDKEEITNNGKSFSEDKDVKGGKYKSDSYLSAGKGVNNDSSLMKMFEEFYRKEFNNKSEAAKMESIDCSESFWVGKLSNVYGLISKIVVCAFSRAKINPLQGLAPIENPEKDREKWNAYARDYYKGNGKETDRKKLLFGTESNTYKMNLFPIAFPHDDEKYWTKAHKQVTGFENKAEYKDFCKNKRFAKLKDLLCTNEYGKKQSRAIVCFGIGQEESFYAAFCGKPREEKAKIGAKKNSWEAHEILENQLHIRIYIMPFLSYRWMNNKALFELGKDIANYLK